VNEHQTTANVDEILSAAIKLRNDFVRRPRKLAPTADEIVLLDRALSVAAAVWRAAQTARVDGRG